MSDVPDDISEAARAVVERGYDEGLLEAVETALMAERERWKPAVIYFDRYCQDEADDDGVEITGCSEQQHEDAKAFAAIRRGTAPAISAVERGKAQ